MTNQNPPAFDRRREDGGYEGPDVETPIDDDDGPSRDTADDLNDSADSYVSPARTDRDDSGVPKPDGLGQDGTIPNAPDGVAAGHTGVPSTFEPEEDEQANP